MKTNVHSLIIRVMSVFLSAGQTVLLARVMGAENLGVYASILALAALLAIPASAGLGEFLTREVAIAKAGRSRNSVRGLVRSSNGLLILYTAVSLICLVAIYVGDINSALDPLLAIAASAQILIMGLERLRAGAMMGLGSAIQSQIPEYVLRPGLFFILLLAQVICGRELGAQEALFTLVLSGLLSAAYGQISLGILIRRCDDDPSERVGVMEVARRSSGQTALGGAHILLTNIDLMIFSIFGFFSDAGYYKVAMLGIVALLMVYNALSAVAVRDLASALARKESAKVLRVTDRLVLIGSAATALVMAIYILIGESAIRIVFGNEFAPAYIALIILSAGNLIGIACGPSVEVIRLLQSQRFGVVMNLISIFILIAITMPLLNWHPLAAVAIGTASANVFRRVTFAVHVSRELGYNTSLLGAVSRLRTAL